MFSPGLWGDCCFSSSYYLGHRNISFQYSFPGAGTRRGPDSVMMPQQKGSYSKAPTYLKIMYRGAVLTAYEQLQQFSWISSWTSVGSDASMEPCESLPTQDILQLKSLENTGAHSSQHQLHMGNPFLKTGKHVKSKPDKITKRNCEKEKRERISLFTSWNVGKLLMPEHCNIMLILIFRPRDYNVYKY